ncbi:MAG: hypothetical protein IIU35_05415, partial [Neisseriaceae bacterium]|nr:hypothetical protein [Neisseriaceae bacterium]
TKTVTYVLAQLLPMLLHCTITTPLQLNEIATSATHSRNDTAVRDKSLTAVCRLVMTAGAFRLPEIIFRLNCV